MSEQPFSTFRHPRHEEVAALLRQGLPIKRVVEQTGLAVRTVRRVRDIEGIEPHPSSRRALTVQEKFDRAIVPMDFGHTGWNGTRYAGSGNPVVTDERKVYHQASHVAFRSRGREPVGIVKQDCGFEHCLTPSHLMDELDRRTVRLAMRALQGLSHPWPECFRGHAWEEYGRVGPDLSLYCQKCNTDQKAKSRQRNS